MTHSVSSPPEPSQQQHKQPEVNEEAQVTRKGIISFLVIIVLLLLLFSGLLVDTLPQTIRQSLQQPTPTHIDQSTAQAQDTIASLVSPGGVISPVLQLYGGQYVVYAQQNAIYFTATIGGTPQLINTPGYMYNRAVPPLLTPSGQLVYSGDGVWLTDIISGTPRQVSSLSSGQIITSLVLSKDGTWAAWSTEPINGDGVINLYAGPLDAPQLVYQGSAAQCPCFRAFAFANGNKTLLLTDDRGDHHSVQYGLWSLNLASASSQEPSLLLDEDPAKGPLALAPAENVLLYSTHLGVVPAPSDTKIPDDVAALSYANSLSVATLGGQPLALKPGQVILPSQRVLSNSADYHWVTTPQFSPDGHTMFYVEFSSDTQIPFHRHSALYSVHMDSTGAKLQVGKPQLLATSSALYLELGKWLNDHVLTYYADGAVYAVDINTNAVATIAQTDTYAHIVAVVGNGVN